MLKNSITFPLVSAATLASCLSLSAQAEEYQYDAFIGLTDNNSYSAAFSSGLSYYFDPVDDTLGPKQLAPWLNKASRIAINYVHVEFPDSDSRDNLSGPTLDFKWFFDNDVFVSLDTTSEWINFKPNQNIKVTDISGSGALLGYVIDPYGYIGVGSYQESDNKDSTFDNIYIQAGLLQHLDNGEMLSWRATLNNFKNDDVAYNGNSVSLSSTYHPTHDFNLGARLHLTDFNTADNRYIAELNSSYFFNSSTSVGMEMRIQKEGQEWYNKQHIYLSKRF